MDATKKLIENNLLELRDISNSTPDAYDYVQFTVPIEEQLDELIPLPGIMAI